LVTRELGIPATASRSIDRDTALVPRGIGSASARSAQIAGSAVHEAAVVVRDLARERAADLLEAPLADIVFADGSFSVRGVPTRTVAWRDVLVAGPVRHALDWTQKGSTFPYGVHAAVVEVDVETGKVELLRFVAVDDCGRLIVPELVDGQAARRRGARHCRGAVRRHRLRLRRHAENRQFGDYLVPSAADLPTIETTAHRDTVAVESDRRRRASANRVRSARRGRHQCRARRARPFGVRDLNPPFTPERVWSALRDAG
jgi:carbon-monoxide dehydrogenase large subunit